jgi:hypothetical protein
MKKNDFRSDFDQGKRMQEVRRNGVASKGQKVEGCLWRIKYAVRVPHKRPLISISNEPLYRSSHTTSLAPFSSIHSQPLMAVIFMTHPT